MYRHLTYFSLLLAACCFLLSPALAEVACEDMPCCIGAAETFDVSQNCQMSESSESLMECGDSMEDCSCSLQSEAPVAESSASLATFIRYEFASQEIEILELPEILLGLREEKPIWHSQVRVPEDQEHASFHAFPNPPPAVA